MEFQTKIESKELEILEDIKSQLKIDGRLPLINKIKYRRIKESLEVLQIIFEAPSILEQLFKLGQLGKKAEDRYYWGTITDSRVEKVKEFFADGKRDQSK